jgi:HEPN domain-containing protein
MPQYDIDFGDRLAKIANQIVEEGLHTDDAQRAVLYLSLLSSEILLKALLEKAGKPVSEIRKHSHDLTALLRELDQCYITDEIVPGVQKRRHATTLRARSVLQTNERATVGFLIDEAERLGASRYPNEIRYGELVRHFHAEVMARMASEIVLWARQHWDDISL